MKANLVLALVLLGGLAAFTLGAGLAGAFTALVAGGLVGVACNDYAASHRAARFGLAA